MDNYNIIWRMQRWGKFAQPRLGERSGQGKLVKYDLVIQDLCQFQKWLPTAYLIEHKPECGGKPSKSWAQHSFLILSVMIPQLQILASIELNTIFQTLFGYFHLNTFVYLASFRCCVCPPPPASTNVIISALQKLLPSFKTHLEW